MVYLETFQYNHFLKFLTFSPFENTLKNKRFFALQSGSAALEQPNFSWFCLVMPSFIWQWWNWLGMTGDVQVIQHFSSNHLQRKRHCNFTSGLCHIYSFQHQFSSVTIMHQTFPSSLKIQCWCRLLLRTRKVIIEFKQNAGLKLRAWVCQLASFLTRCLDLMSFHLLKWLPWVSLNHMAVSASGGSARLVWQAGLHERGLQ